MPKKIIVRETDYHGVGYIIIADADGTIYEQINYTWEENITEVIIDLIKLMMKYPPDTLHFLDEDEVNHYLAMAPISEYPSDEDEEDE